MFCEFFVREYIKKNAAKGLERSRKGRKRTTEAVREQQR
jgi:hypothetical protein